VLLRLVTDENSYIRNKACHIIYSKSNAIHNDNFGVEFLMDEFVRSLLEKRKAIAEAKSIEDFEKQVGNFILDLIYVKETSRIKYLHTYDQRIFSLDKPNKYAEDVIIKRAIWKWREELRNLLEKYFKNIKQDHNVDDYVKSRGIYIPKDYVEEYKKYVSYAMIRSEFIFDGIVNQRLMEYFFDIDVNKKEAIYHEGTKQKLDDIKFREKYLSDFKNF